MGRLRVLSGREVCRILTENGFAEVRQRGSHIVMQRRTAESTITVPVPNHSELRVGTLLSIIRQSGIPRSLFEHEGK
ncbi:MAG: type II toxin-antitoxin system HicA family toxin [Planctomycetota bacterium]